MWTESHRRRTELALALAVPLACSALLAAVIFAQTGLRPEPLGFARYLILATAMAALAAWCVKRRMDQRMAAAAAVVAVATVSLMLCAIVSNAGLRLGAPLIDGGLATTDAALGLHVDRIVRSMAAHPWLIDGLAAVYNASGVAVAGMLLFALARLPIGKTWELLTTLVITMQAVAALSIAMPAAGAMKYLGMLDLQGGGLPAGAGVYHLAAFDHFRGGADTVLRVTELSGLVTFPSFHTVLGLLAAQALAETRLRWAGVAWASAVIVSTVPIGGHYVTDIAAGLTVWLLAAAVARRVSTPSA